MLATSCHTHSLPPPPRSGDDSPGRGERGALVNELGKGAAPVQRRCDGLADCPLRACVRIEATATTASCKGLSEPDQRQTARSEGRPERAPGGAGGRRARSGCSCEACSAHRSHRPCASPCGVNYSHLGSRSEWRDKGRDVGRGCGRGRGAERGCNPQGLPPLRHQHDGRALQEGAAARTRRARPRPDRRRSVCRPARGGRGRLWGAVDEGVCGALSAAGGDSESPGRGRTGSPSACQGGTCSRRVALDARHAMRLSLEVREGLRPKAKSHFNEPLPPHRSVQARGLLL